MKSYIFHRDEHETQRLIYFEEGAKVMDVQQHTLITDIPSIAMKKDLLNQSTKDDFQNNTFTKTRMSSLAIMKKRKHFVHFI